MDTIHAFNDFDLPLDSSNLTSMNEYNLSLCLFSDMFSRDKYSQPMSHILSQWDFDEESTSYVFEIDERAKWSDGTPLKSEDLILSILRLAKASPTNFLSLSSLMSGEIQHYSSEFPSHSGIVRLNERRFSISFKDKGTEFFKRISSGIAPIIRKDQIDPASHVIVNHSASVGPYKIVPSSNSSELILEKNEFYLGERKNMAKTIVFRHHPKEGLNSRVLLQEASWPSVLTDRAYLSKDFFEEAKEAQLSIWTRPVDRITLMFPSKGFLMKQDAHEIMRWIGGELESAKLDFSGFFGARRALSLQPQGFILHTNIRYQQIQKPNLSKGSYKIGFFGVAFLGEENKIARLISDTMNQIGLPNTFATHPFSEIKSFQDKDDFDFIVTDFGAADPDPVVWLSLVLDSSVKFIGDFDGNIAKRYKQIIHEPEDSHRNELLRSLLYEAGVKGVYLPLAHHSSIALAKPFISFENIWESDETVDFSKLMITGK